MKWPFCRWFHMVPPNKMRPIFITFWCSLVVEHAQRWGSEHSKHIATRLLSLSVSLCLELQRGSLSPNYSYDTQLWSEILAGQCLSVDWTGNKIAALCPFNNIFIYLGKHTRTGFHAYIREKQQVKRMCTQRHEWGAILSWEANLEKNRKQDASECRLWLPQARAKRLRVIGKLITAAGVLQAFLFP